MYRNKNFTRKIFFRFSPWLVYLVVFILVALIIYFSYKYVLNKRKLSNKLTMVEEYMYDYTLIKVSDYLDDSRIDFIVKSFEFNDKMVSLKKALPNGSFEDNYEWNTNTEAFLDLINMVASVMVASSIKTSSYYKSPVAWKIVEHFVIKTMDRIPIPPSNFSFPWGTNWYQFSISFPIFITQANFLYRKQFNNYNQLLNKSMARYIQNYLIAPKTPIGIQSMGYNRDGVNAIQMSVPYLAGRLVLRTLDLNDTVCQFVKKYLEFEYVSIGNGFYPDYGFIFHTELRSYGYINSALPEIKFTGSFFDIDSVKNLSRIYEIVEHPKLKVHYSPWFTRAGSLRTTNSKYGVIGFYVIDSIKAVIAKTDDWMLAYNGQADHLCYYESDAANYTWGQYWFSARMFLYQDTSPNLQRELVTRYPGVLSYDNLVVEFKTTTTTTTTHMPTYGKTRICQLYNVIGILNEYSIKYNTFSLEVSELSLITDEGIHSYYSLKPDLTAHSQSPVTCSINLGEMPAVQGQMVGIGKQYQFKNNYTFVYDNGGNVYIDSVVDPETKKKISSLQIKPKLRREECEFGFSTVHLNVNSLIEPPKKNSIKTERYSLTFDDDKPYLLLKDHTKQEAAFAQVMGATYQKQISMPESEIIDKFNGNYTVRGGVKINSEIRAPTNNRYQLVLDYKF